MRIRSTLLQDSLYRRNPSGRDDRTSRKLIRLLLGMALVIAVMRQAGDARFYEAFFPAEPPAESTIGHGIDTATSTRQFAQRQTMAPPEVLPDPQLVDQFQQRIDAIDDTALRQLMRQLAATSQGGQADKRAGDAPDQRQPGADAAKDSFPWPAPVAQMLAELNAQQHDAVVRASLQRALDIWALQRVDQTAVWKSRDRLAFDRFLDPAAVQAWRDQPARRPGVVSMIQQPQVYLGSRVLMSANVARAIHQTAGESVADGPGHWEVWLRPHDGSDRPIVVYTGDVPAEVADVPPEATLADGPKVWVEGIFLKRIAYRSTVGRELAPGIVGIIHTSTAPAMAAEPPSRGQVSEPPSLALLVAIAALIGGVVTLSVYFQSRRATARSRALRLATSTADVTFLDSAAAGSADRTSVAARPAAAESSPAAPHR